ncbi:hypothetical protein B0H13DRAFT_1649057 [Mycena leptocephala]|nr:hypothetical protein B0H13DRAFT_1649057 [Mycena leptocephala]
MPAGGSSGRSGPPPSSAIPPCPAKAPEWFKHAHEVITGAALGPQFNMLIAELIRLEAKYEFKKSGRAIPAQGRPKELTTWIAAGRGRRGGSGADGPTLSATGAADFGKVWWAWWASVQPGFRNLSERPWPHQMASVHSSSPKDWTRLRHPGPNGMFIVVLGLYWWGRETMQASAKARASWREAVEDAKWMCEGLILMEDKATQETGATLGETDMESDQLRSE